MHRWGNKKDMIGDDPPYLSVGTEVSAKYKGAFCEAKIRKVVKSVKCKVQYKNEQGTAFVSDEQIKGLLMPGASVEVKLPEKKDAIEGTIVKLQDLSQYTVVFDDGDIATLRRTALCLKSGRHFAESETLDQLPLTHPEHFSTPVVSGSRGSRRRDDMDENSDDEEKQPKIEREEDMGKVVCVEIGDKKKSKDNWFPGLVVAPNAQDSVKIDVEEEYLVRSFKDGRYYTVPKNETTDFTRDMGAKVENVTLKQAVEKAISFIDKNDLPPHWDREQLFRQGESSSDSDESDSDSMDDEPREEKDHFVAQLYKFMDDRGTPINKGPVIASRDVDLYRFFKIVYKSGGYNRVTNRSQWKAVTLKLGFTVSYTNNVKAAYKKYLHSFEDFYRKLGCTLLTRTDNKLRSRSSRPLIRDRDKSAPDKLLLDKDENSSSTNEDIGDVKESSSVKARIVESPAGDESNLSRLSSDAKKDLNTKVTKTRDPSAESIKDKKIESNTTTKDAGLVQCSIEEVKEEKLLTEKRAERKLAVKPASKLDEANEKTKATKSGKRAKPVEKRIRKAENALTQMKEKRSLKERMKAIVHKLKLKSANSSDQEKKKQKPAEEMNKFLSQGLRIKLKDELASSAIKSRKLSAGSNDSRSSSSGLTNDKKVPAPIAVANNSVTETSSGNAMPFSKVKKSEDENGENFKRKSTSRKKKDDDKQCTTSGESHMFDAIEFVPHYKTICIGDKLKVYYEPTHESKVTYEAKVTNKRHHGSVTEYLVHYTGWNTRYDEWIRRSRIADNLSWTPARAKRKSNQIDVASASQTSIQEKAETQPPPNSNVIKTEKCKPASQSPVAKNRSKMSIKGGMKQMKNLKNKLECKTKKTAAQKDSDSGSGSEDESTRKRKLQKTRSRTEKKKQQDGDSSSTKDNEKETELKKKASPPFKRTRSGSIKLDNKDSTKKRKLSPSTAANKGSTIRNSIIKSLVPRKRVNARTKESKDEKDVREISPITNEVYENEMEDLAEDVKPSLDSLEISISAIPVAEKDDDDKSFVLKIDRASPDTLESDVLEENESKISSEDTPLVTPPKKEALDISEETLVPRVIIPQSLADSYLAESLEVKPIVVKTKVKKDSDEKTPSPSKTPVRSPSEKTVTKSIFTSRSPSEKKNEKTPEKDGKLRNVSTFTSYLNMDKIDYIKKGNGGEKSEKPEKCPTTTTSTKASGSVDDIYEFNEPEPVAIDDRAILHRRPTPRIFEDNNVKRAKLVTSTVDSIKEVEEPSKLSEDMDIVETKLIPVKKFTLEVECHTSEKDDEEEASDDENLDEDIMKADISLESVKSIILRSSPIDREMHESPVSFLTANERLGDSTLDKSDDDDDDADESKLVISEADPGVELEEEAKEEITSEVLCSIAPSIAKQEDEVKKDDTMETSNDGMQDKVTKKTNAEEKSKLVGKGEDAGSQPHSSNQDNVLNEVDKVETELSAANKKEAVRKEDMDVDEYPKSKYEEDVHDGLLLCEETIPKSPEAKETNDMDVDHPCSARGATTEKKASDPQVLKMKKESRSNSFVTSNNDTPPTTPEGSNSTPGTSPSEEVSGFSSTTFSLNEKSCSNKDSSENETSSETSEKPAKVKKYSNEAYVKKNAFEIGTYLKKEAEQIVELKEEVPKKKKSLPDNSVNGSDKEDSNDIGSLPQPEEPPKPKSSIAYILEQIPPEYDSNQRIEFLEQKMEEVRKKYMHYKQEVAIIDKKRKKLRRKQREGRMMTRNEANSLLV